jgi:hypothetical protein
MSTEADGERACPACSTRNPAAAPFCWQCYAPFGQGVSRAAAAPPVALPPARPGSAGALGPRRLDLPAPPPVEPPSPRRALGQKLLGGAVALAAALGVSTFLGRDGISFPEEIDGARRIDAPVVEQLEEAVRDNSDGFFEAHPEIAVYGSGDVPEFVIAAASGSTVETTDQLIDAYAQGAEASGANVDRAGMTGGERDGSEYRCVATVAPIETATCLWRDDESFGLVLALERDVDATEDLLFTVRDQILE